MADGYTAGRDSADPYAAFFPDLIEAVLRRQGARDWSVTPEDFWCRVHPGDAGAGRRQGWKLHVSATPLSAPMVLTRAAEVLVAARAAFKCAGTPARLTELVSTRCDRGSGGKFITVYPDDDDHFRQLAEQLHRVTTHLPGPGILSDRPYRPGSLVHYRYGAFRGFPRLTNDGSPEPMLQAPDGGFVRDRRQAGFSPPPWAVSPLPPPENPPAAPGTSVLLNDRYVVHKAVRHAYKGGVFLGTDQRTGQEVVIKEARRHVGATLEGSDAGDRLGHEAEMHALLAPLGVCPRVLGVFGQGGNRYLAEERVAGRTLRSWTSERLRPDRASVLDLARQVVDVVAAVHGLGLVLQDLNPNNLMVTPDGEVRLIDLEALARPGDHVRRIHTPGFGAPEVLDGPSTAPAPALTSDLYSLGAVLFHLLTGADPVLGPDHGTTRDRHDRLAALLAAVLADRPELTAFQPLVLGLMAEDRDDRWSLDAVREALAGLRAAAPVDAPPTGVGSAGVGGVGVGSGGVGSVGAGGAGVGSAGGGVVCDGRAVLDGGAVLDGPTAERLLSDGLTHLMDTMTPLDPVRLWPADASGERTDPLNVQHGAAGILAVLTAAATHRTDPRLRATVAEAASWIAARAEVGGQLLPGLHFGRSGTAWALLDAARLLDDDGLAGHAAGLAREVPVRWPNPDVCHGVAGAGLTQLHFWRATGDKEFRERAVAAAEHLLTTAAKGRSGVVWPVPADFDSELAGITHLGFAHGVAGVGTFLLLAGLAAEREDLVHAARAAAETLLATVRVRDGGAGWPVEDRSADAPVHAPHWCSGASGIGTFLIRLWQATGDLRYRETAERAATEVYRWRWRSSSTACHGLAGNAEYLLDLAEALDDPVHRRRAGELLACAHARHVVHDGLLLIPDDTLTGVGVGYNTGLGGPLGLLVRLQHGGPRLWLPAPDPAGRR
ncbi:class IV lanthionine synthetase LanL [Kitasatospora xanthocidica]|uniref:class IV lanthionine synthetase LanL n=1 Tax=Kitasatospora xanthocidica TaxID=83382 RepID=UPI0036E9D598